jgi:hypothetical protein
LSELASTLALMSYKLSRVSYLLSKHIGRPNKLSEVGERLSELSRKLTELQKSEPSGALSSKLTSRLDELLNELAGMHTQMNSLIELPEDYRPKQLQSNEKLMLQRRLLAIAVGFLPPSERDRYFEEFSAELLNLPRNKRLRHALSLLRGVFMLRLRGDAKNKAADAPREEGVKE